MNKWLWTMSSSAVALGLAASLHAMPAGRAQSPLAKPVKVTIQDAESKFSDGVLPLDPAIRVDYQFSPDMTFGVNSEGKRLTCGAGSCIPTFKIDGKLFYPDELLIPQVMPQKQAGLNGRIMLPQPQPLPPGPNNKKRTGMQITWKQGEVKGAVIFEVVPGRPYEKNSAAPRKRRMDTLLVKYIFENNDNKSHEIGMRMFIDTMCGNNDGAIFASPTTVPGKLLDGMTLQGKDVPEFLEMLENPDLKNPGFTGIFTFKIGNKVDGPNRIVMTSTSAIVGDWDIMAAPAMGDSALALFWDPKEVKAKSKREVAFAIGQSIACNPESEGRVSLQFGGSFEPHKAFTITAYVEDPFDGQNLSLELPKGMERFDGKSVQPVPPPVREDGQSVVMWRCRVLEMGTFPIRIRSSNGVTETRIVTVSPGE